MSSIFNNLKPQSLWNHFEKILEIPHCSGNEKALGDYIIQVANHNKLSWKRDKVGNVLVEKAATPGHENSEIVILQGHLDMVCEKNSDVSHDFTRDKIKAEIEGDWVRARGTTLGADNGIGLSAALAVMEDDKLTHGPLEFLFTVDEETGLTGATQISPDFLKGRKLLNLDSEKEGSFTIGCAGGGDSEIDFPLKREKYQKKNAYRLKIFGLKGGHSGLDIHRNRGNAIKILSRMLYQTSKASSLELVRIEGGNKRNAIPREAWADILISPENFLKFSDILNQTFQKIRAEYRITESDLKYSFEKAEKIEEKPLSADSTKFLLSLLLALPHGVLAMHPEIEGLVETSTNLALITTKKDSIQIILSSRSSLTSALEATRETIAAISELAGAKITQPEGYPGWTPNLDSQLLKIFKEVYRKNFNQEPEVCAVHAGLECGILGEKFPGMDMISFGPDIENPHSPDERVHIGSVEKFFNFLTAVLIELG